MPLRDKIEHAIQNQPCTVKDLKAKFGGDRGADRKVMEALDQLVHEAVICQKQGVFFTVRSGRAEKALLCKVVKLGKNFAFVMLDDGTSDIFIPGRFTRGAMPGDEVLVEKFAHPRVEGSDEMEDFQNTEKTVAFFFVSTDGTIVVRRTEDYIPSMIELAGGRHVFQDLTGAEATSSSVSLSMEEFYAAAKDADYLVYNATIDNPIMLGM